MSGTRSLAFVNELQTNKCKISIKLKSPISHNTFVLNLYTFPHASDLYFLKYPNAALFHSYGNLLCSQPLPFYKTVIVYILPKNKKIDIIAPY